MGFGRVECGVVGGPTVGEGLVSLEEQPPGSRLRYVDARGDGLVRQVEQAEVVVGEGHADGLGVRAWRGCRGPLAQRTGRGAGESLDHEGRGRTVGQDDLVLVDRQAGVRSPYHQARAAVDIQPSAPAGDVGHRPGGEVLPPESVGRPLHRVGAPRGGLPAQGDPVHRVRSPQVDGEPAVRAGAVRP